MLRANGKNYNPEGVENE